MKTKKILKRLRRLLLILIIPILLIFVPIGISKLYNTIRTSFLTDNEKRIEDLERLIYVMQNEFAGYNVLEGTKDFEKQVANLRTLALDPSVSQTAYNLELIKAVAAFKDPHTATANSYELFNTYFPYRVTWSDGAFYLTSGQVDTKWLGAKVIRFDQKDSELFFSKLIQYTSSPNKSGNAAFMSRYQSNTELLFHEKIIDDPKKITLELSLSNGETTKISFESMTNEAINNLTDYNRLSSIHKENQALWKTNSAKNYWYKYLEKENLFYLRYSFCVAQGDINLFWKEVFEQIEKTDPAKVVIDLRGNPGGDTQNHVFFLNELTKNEAINSYGKLYTLIDRRTGSAAVSLASNLERLTNTILVGEKTIDLANTTSDPTFFTLPHSGLKILVPSLYLLNTHVYDKRDAVIPDVPINQLIDDKNYAQDQVLDSVIRMEHSEKADAFVGVALPSEAKGNYYFSPIRNLKLTVENDIWWLEIDGLVKAELHQMDSLIFSDKYDIELSLIDTTFNKIGLKLHGSEIILNKIERDAKSLISNINNRNFESAKSQLVKIRSNGELPYYLRRPFFQTNTYDIFLKDGFETAYEFNQITKSQFPDDAVVSIIDYELYQYNSNTLGQVKSVFPILGKLIKRYYKVITTDKIMNDDYNPFIGK